MVQDTEAKSKKNSIRVSCGEALRWQAGDYPKDLHSHRHGRRFDSPEAVHSTRPITGRSNEILLTNA